MRANVYLKKNEDKRIRQGHPWIFSNEIKTCEGLYEDGDIVDVYDHKKKYIGSGYFNSHSLIAIRILTRENVAINRFFFQSKILKALQYREKITGEKDAFRVIFGESDHLPGLIVDKYKSFLVVQFLTLGIEKFRYDIIDILKELFDPEGIILRNDSSFRKLEGLKQEKIILGGIKNENKDIIIEEGNIKFKVDLWEGQKTGFFLDQRDNRDYFSALSLSGKGLDCFCYSGAWGMRDTEASEVTFLDSSESAISLVRINAELNSKIDNIKVRKEDVFEFLSSNITRGETFDWIVLDPPAFVKNKKSIKKAIYRYRELNLKAMKLLKEGGILITCSCSYNLKEDTFTRLIKEASIEVNKEIRVIACGNQAKDHPVLISMPESKYLKCFFLQIL
ncbi:MAG TPA: class I SAM-dependent rRNA methyltransferase [Candidatus Eremiobacteraeota bacterium]|nr:MAG: Ribosomal RNA large subunit methyltransferase I [bacterium ADurb.Bin363]HPZ08606.1 class I SAM-dependent rRNA methyltransferase [Candidatus Eremiobacteraeota bacterium]